VRRGDQWVGDIFDGLGCIEGFRRRGLPLAGKRLMLIGAGGAGTAIGVAAAFEHPQSMRLFDPDQARVVALAAKIRSVDPAIEVTIAEASIAASTSSSTHRRSACSTTRACRSTLPASRRRSSYSMRS
jgi:shikimate 5-dehydrogenase